MSCKTIIEETIAAKIDIGEIRTSTRRSIQYKKTS